MAALLHRPRRTVETGEVSAPRAPRRREFACVACREVVRFAWQCRQCAFTMCQRCMEENRWGMTCNNITWTCPDCGADNNYGNQ